MKQITVLVNHETGHVADFHFNEKEFRKILTPHENDDYATTLQKSYITEELNANVPKNIALSAANEIADQFSSGFFDDGMVNHIAKIIENHIS